MEVVALVVGGVALVSSIRQLRSSLYITSQLAALKKEIGELETLHERQRGQVEAEVETLRRLVRPPT